MGMDGARDVVVALAGVSKALGGRSVLEDVTLEVAAGETVAVVGPSGAGKSVLLRLLLGLLRPDAGVVRVAAARSAARAAAVFQGDALFDELTVAANVSFPLPRKGLSATERVARVQGALEAVGIGVGAMALRPMELSGGMRKRVAIARAMLTDARLVVLDEPTSGLDPASAGQVVEAIRALLAADRTRACILVTHDQGAAEALATRTVFMDRTARTLVPCPGGPAEARERLAAGLPPPAVAVRRGLGARIGAGLAGVGRALVRVPGTALALLAGGPPPVGATLRRAAGMALGSLPVMLLAGALLGAITCLQLGSGFRLLDYYDEVPPILGELLPSRLAPLLGGLFLVSRTAAAVGAEFAVKAYTEQHAAMVTMGERPERHWLAPLLVAAAVVFPLMVAVFGAAFLAGAGAAFTTVLGQNALLFQSRVFVPEFGSMAGAGLARSALAGVLACGVSYGLGLLPKKSSADIGAGATRSVVLALLVVVLVELAFGIAGA